VMLMDTSNVESVIIRGRVMKHAGRLVDVDVAAVIGALQRSVEGITARSGHPNILFTSCRA
jgi:5-methylthioadenosine/S-adenosylhomocysteine deaminase